METLLKCRAAGDTVGSFKRKFIRFKEL